MKRISLIKTLFVSLAFCLALSCGFAINSAIVKADDEQSAAVTFQMGVGASIRVDNATETPAHGIRFRAMMDEDTKNSLESEGVSFGFLIFPAAYLPENASATTDYHGKDVIKDYEDIAGDTSKIYKDGDVYYANAALVNIKDANLSLDFTAVCYIKNGETYTYTAPAEKRNVSGVASAGYINDAENRTALTSAFTKLGTSELPIEITGINDFNVIATDVNKEENAETFNGVNFKLMQDVTVPENNTEIGKNFAGSIDGNQKTVSRRFTDHLLADASKLTNVKENLTVEGVEIKINDAKIYECDYNNNYTTSSETGATLTSVDKTNVEEIVVAAIGINGVTSETVYTTTNTNGQAKGRYALYMNFNKDDVESLINAGYSNLSFKYAIYQSDSEKGTSINYNTASSPYAYGDQREIASLNFKSSTLGTISFSTISVPLINVLSCFDNNGALRIFTIGGASIARTVYFADFALSDGNINLLSESKDILSKVTGNAEEGWKYITNEEVSELKHGSDVVNNYCDDFGAFNIKYQDFESSGESSSGLKLKLLCSKDDLQVAKNKGFNYVSIWILLANSANGADACETQYVEIVKGDKSVLDSSIKFDGTTYNYGQWTKIQISIDNIINKISDDNCIVLFDSIKKVGPYGGQYLGKIELTKSAD